MQLKEIRVADLPDFVKSEFWQQLKPKPITASRVDSQSRNPCADADDIALLIAWENDQLIGLVGLLPHLINGQKGQKAYSNTCWWAHPEKGKQLAIPLFLKAYSLCGQRMFMTDCTPHTLSILEKTNWFDFPDTPLGIRGFLKLNLHEILPSKFPATKKLKPLLKFSDQTFNLLLTPYQKIRQSRFNKTAPITKQLTSLNEELYAFIENHSLGEFTRRSGKELEWIIQFPWLKVRNTEQSPIDYPFSNLVENFEQYFIQIKSLDQTIGLVFVSIRDGHMKIPYAYLDEKEAHQVLKAIYQQAFIKKAVTLTIFNLILVNAMEDRTHPFIFKKKIKRLMAISKQLSELYHQYPLLQDGDGDVVFT